MKKLKQVLQRPLAALAALALLVGAAAPMLSHGIASADQVTSRSIKISNSAPSATGTSYLVSFTPAQASNIGGIVVDFCSDTPLIGTATCNYPAGFTMGSTPTVSAPTGFSTSTGSWVTTSSAQGGAGAGQTQTLFLTNATPQTPTNTSTPITFTISGVTNPSATTTFFARILTFDTNTNATTSYTVSGTTRSTSTLTGLIDDGGIALTTAPVINVTARVMETISFCVYPDVWPIGAASGTGVCGNTPSLELGTGTPQVIDSAAVYTGKIKFDLSSNATNGVNIRLKGDTLTSGANTIGAINSGGGGASVTMTKGETTGNAAFGLGVPTSTTTGGTDPLGEVAADANYDGGVGNDHYGFDTTSTDNITTTYGDIIANTNSAPLHNITTPVTYAATAALTTPAGVYTSSEQMIATGTF